jgi:hypothetical protein
MPATAGLQTGAGTSATIKMPETVLMEATTGIEQQEGHCGGGIHNTTRQRDCQLDTVHVFSLLGGLTVGITKRCTYMSPQRMRSNAVGGGGGTILAWRGKVQL